MDDARSRSPAAERNRAPILAELRRLLPVHGLALEIAAGSGQHAAHFAAALPGWRWLPTDAEARSLASIDAWCAGLSNVLPAQRLDVVGPVWSAAPAEVDAIFCANLLHIAPWPACAGLMAGAARHLARHGLLLVYGPFFVDGEAPAPGNVAFDADLRSRHAEWGVRRLADVLVQAGAAGLAQRERVAMPANNQLLVFERTGPVQAGTSAAASAPNA